MGLALFYGDGMLTPAISVLSAMEGLGAGRRLQALDHAADPGHPGRAVPGAEPRHRKDRQGVRAGDGAVVHRAGGAGRHRDRASAADPAAPPIRAMRVALFVTEPWTAFVALGSVVLAVTGCEALYADMGHFGARAIRWAWLYFAFPALVLNYFGQGALLLSNPACGAVPVLCPGAGLAALSHGGAGDHRHHHRLQAVICGVFSITRQAVQLGQLPRMEIRHTQRPRDGPDLCAAHPTPCWRWAWC